MQKKSKILRLFFSLTLGFFAVDRFYMKKIITASIKLLMTIILLVLITYLLIKFIPSWNSIIEKIEKVAKDAAKEHKIKNIMATEEEMKKVGYYAAIQYIWLTFKIDVVIVFISIFIFIIMFIWWIVDVILAIFSSSNYYKKNKI